MERLGTGPLSVLAPDQPILLDGGHNPDAGAALARHFTGKRIHLVIGMLANKDPAALMGPMRESLASITAVPVPTHEHHPVTAFGSGVASADDVTGALAGLPDDGLPVLIAGSLYLAGEVLRLNGEAPD